MNNNFCSVKEVSEALGVPKYTVSRLCNQGLVPHVRRNEHGRRILEPWQVDLIAILLNMKQAGFRSRDIRRYVQLFRQGKHTEAERLAMLTTRKRQLWHEIEVRQKAIDFIERQEENMSATKNAPQNTP